jgi:hypothetical protein
MTWSSYSPGLISGEAEPDVTRRQVFDTIAEGEGRKIE